jgi:hypothetical protein
VEVYGNLETATALAAKQNFDQDVMRGNTSADGFQNEETKRIYFEEARDLLLPEGENYPPEYGHFPHIKYQPN